MIHTVGVTYSTNLTSIVLESQLTIRKYTRDTGEYEVNIVSKFHVSLSLEIETCLSFAL